MPQIYFLAYQDTNGELTLKANKRHYISYDSLPPYAIIPFRASDNSFRETEVFLRSYHLETLPTDILIYFADRHFRRLRSLILQVYRKNIGSTNLFSIDPHERFDVHFSDGQLAARTSFQVFCLEGKMPRVWDNLNYRRVITLCLLFPNQPDKILHYVTLRHPMDWEAAASDLIDSRSVEDEFRYLQHDDNENPLPILLDRRRAEVEELVKSKLCLSNMTIDILRTKFEGMFVGTYQTDFAAPLLDFFSNGFLQAERPESVSGAPHIRLIKYGSWALLLSIPDPQDTNRGRLEDQRYVHELYGEGLEYQNVARKVVKVLAAPALGERVTQRARRAALGVHLIDSVSSIFLHKHQIEHDSPSGRAIDNFVFFFRQRAGLLDVEQGLANFYDNPPNT
jgi:hypothetical protein